nr:hypothetical protein [uncultured Methanobacterium sp.]
MPKIVFTARELEKMEEMDAKIWSSKNATSYTFEASDINQNFTCNF